FYLIGRIAGRFLPPAYALRCLDTAVKNKAPLFTLVIYSLPGVVDTGFMRLAGRRTKQRSHRLSGLLPGDARHLDLAAKLLVTEVKGQRASPYTSRQTRRNAFPFVFSLITASFNRKSPNTLPYVGYALGPDRALCLILCSCHFSGACALVALCHLCGRLGPLRQHPFLIRFLDPIQQTLASHQCHRHIEQSFSACVLVQQRCGLEEIFNHLHAF